MGGGAPEATGREGRKTGPRMSQSCQDVDAGCWAVKELQLGQLGPCKLPAKQLVSGFGGFLIESARHCQICCPQQLCVLFAAFGFFLGYTMFD